MYCIVMYVCMYVWMDGWMDGWMCVCIDGWMDMCMYWCMHGWMDGCITDKIVFLLSLNIFLVPRFLFFSYDVDMYVCIIDKIVFYVVIEDLPWPRFLTMWIWMYVFLLLKIFLVPKFILFSYDVDFATKKVGSVQTQAYPKLHPPRHFLPYLSPVKVSSGPFSMIDWESLQILSCGLIVMCQ